MFNNENHKRTIKKDHDIGWKINSFKSDEVSMLGHECGSSVFP